MEQTPTAQAVQAPSGGSVARRLLVVAGAAAALGLSHLLDKPVYDLVGGYQFPTHQPEWYVLLRFCGYLPLWLLVAFSLLLVGSAPVSPERRHGVRLQGVGLAVATLVSGAAAELLKMLVRRLRPPAGGWDGHYLFRSWSESPWSNSGLGCPSSHVAVAVAAGLVLYRVQPRLWPVSLIIVIGCAAVRVHARAHFLSDVAVAIALGWLSVWLVQRWLNLGWVARTR